MATSKCPACPSTSFEMIEATIDGAKYKNKFIQCARCGAVVGVLTGKDAGVLVGDALNELAEVKKQLAAILARLP